VFASSRVQLIYAGRLPPEGFEIFIRSARLTVEGSTFSALPMRSAHTIKISPLGNVAKSIQLEIASSWPLLFLSQGSGLYEKLTT